MSRNRFLLAGALAAFVFACLPPLAAASVLPDQFQIQDYGQPRVFEVATNELNIITPAHVHTRQTLTNAPNTAAVRAQAEALRRATGNEVGLVLYEAGRPRNQFTRRVLTRQVLVQLPPKSDTAALAASLGATSRSEISFAPGYFLFETPEAGGALALAAQLAMQPGVISAEPLIARQQQKKFTPNDTYFTNQWHLLNQGQNGGTPGIDVNITNVWDSYQGDGICIGIVDDGLQHTHPDLEPNYNAAASTNINDGNADPSPDVTSDFHGTPCAGIAAAVGNNSLGVCGAAFHASLAGLRLLGAAETDVDEANAMSYRNDLTHIKSNSWGPPDDGQTVAGPGPLTLAALAAAAQTGRGSNGTIFVWAAGNGLQNLDNANYNGYANSIYSIAVSAISDQGTQTDNSEPGACILVTAPSSSAGRQEITTVDLLGNNGYNVAGVTGDLSDRNYTKTFGDTTLDSADSTSAATPLVAGVVALMLEANPNLGWRDVQEILMRSATKNDPTDADWVTNSAGFHFNHKYGAGLVNARAAVNLAIAWTNLPAQTSISVTQANLSVPIPDNDPNGITTNFNLSSSNLRVERVTLTVNIVHPYRGDLAITLTSPGGIQSRLAELHNDPNANYAFWTFSTVHDWGENSAGKWTLKIADLSAGDVGTNTYLALTVYGTPATVSSNVFRILSVLPTTTNTTISFTSVTNSAYLVQRRTNLSVGSWTTVASNVPATGSTTKVLDSTHSQAACFYRVQLLP